MHLNEAPKPRVGGPTITTGFAFPLCYIPYTAKPAVFLDLRFLFTALINLKYPLLFLFCRG